MSLDFSMIARMIVDVWYPRKKDLDTFTDQKHQYHTADAYIGKTERFVLNVFMWTISICISLIAFWLSWSCNEAMGYSVALRAMFGALAFFFGMIYISLYFIMRWDVCYAAKYNKK